MERNTQHHHEVETIFYHLYPNDKGGFWNAGVNIYYDGDDNFLKEEAEYKLRKNGINIYKRSIQYGPTKEQFYIYNITDNKKIKYWLIN